MSALNLKFYYKFFKIIFRSILASILIFFKWIFHCFVPPPLKNISGQLALITGSSSGIGRAIAFRLAKEGCNIAIVNRNHELGQKVADEIRMLYNVDARAFKTDVSKQQDVIKLKHDVEESMGTVDILVNNAGLLAFENSLLEGDDEDYQKIIDTNLTAYFWTTRAFLKPMMEKRQGHIVSISSLVTKCTIFNCVVYSTTKFGNVGFMEALNDDLNFYGYGDCIKTTTVLPSFVVTQKKHTDLISLICDMPLEDPNEIADMIVCGMLQNRRKFIVPPSAALFSILSWFPDSVQNEAKLSVLNMENIERYKKIREGKE